MNGWVVLRRARITLLFFLFLICLAWATLFAIFLSHEWTHSSPPQKILVIVFLFLDVFTAVLLYLMAVMHVCPWWDFSRMFAILLVHTGISVLFTHYKASFSCLGFDTETVCKDMVFAIFIGCWVSSGTTLCFVIALGVMAFIPRPLDPEAALESLPLARTEEDEIPSNLNPDRFKAGRRTDERRPSLSPIHTGLPVVTYNNGGELPGDSSSPYRNASPERNIHREASTLEPPHLWQGFERKDLRHGNKNRTRGATISIMRSVPGGSTRIGPSVPQRADSFGRRYFAYSPPSRQFPVHSSESMIRPAVGRTNSPVATVRPNRTSTFPNLRHNPLPPVPLRNTPSLVTMPRDRATEYPPRVFSVLSNNSVLTPPWDISQPTYPDNNATKTPDVYSFHPAPANVHPVMVEPPPYGLLPSVPTPRVERFQDIGVFWGPNDISAGNNAPPVRSVSQAHRTVQRSGEGTSHHAGIPPVKKVHFLRRGSELDETQWWGLVRGAAAKP